VAESAPEPSRADFVLVPPQETGDTPVFYANFVQATFSPLDATIHLGWYATPTVDEQPTEPVQVPVRGLAKVSLPIGLIPGMIELLQRQLMAWQESMRELQAQAQGQEDQPR
jgi:hypothetical protein